MRLGHIELFVRDLGVARDFYVDVLGCREAHPEVGRVHWLELGDLAILLRPGNPRTTTEQYVEASEGLVLYTDDLDATMADLRERGLQFEGTDGSPRCPTFTDPDGNWFQLVDPSEQ